jgi:5-methylcytosine-specific restriction protein A
MDLELVESWEDILDNAHNFNNFSDSSNFNNSDAFNRFGKFSNWYYFPAQGFFAPNKFIGYKNTTFESYDGDGHGSRTKNILNNYFVQIIPGSDNFNKIKTELEKFVNLHGHNVSSKTYSTGGIFYPKKEYLGLEENFNDSLIQGGEPIDIIEGGKKMKYVSYYERDPRMRTNVINKKGTMCSACGFNFQNIYGERGRDYIEVHHIKPISSFNDKHHVNPDTDMEVVCSNCHRMIHRSRNNVLSIDDLKKIINNSKLNLSNK